MNVVRNPSQVNRLMMSRFVLPGPRCTGLSLTDASGSGHLGTWLCLLFRAA